MNEQLLENLLLQGRVSVDDNGCWLWLRRLDRDGYGRLPRGVTAHRAIYRRANGAIPIGMEIDHTCRVRRCVNPDHLEAVTGEENNRRRDAARGWGEFA